MKFLTNFNVAVGLNAISLLSLLYVLWRVRELGKGAFAPKTPEQRSGRILWALSIFKFISGNGKVWILAFIGATSSIKWNDIDGFTKLCIILIASAQALTHAEAFFDQTAARLAAGKPPIGTNGTDNTKHFMKEQVEAPKQP